MYFFSRQCERGGSEVEMKSIKRCYESIHSELVSPQINRDVLQVYIIRLLRGEIKSIVSHSPIFFMMNSILG